MTVEIEDFRLAEVYSIDFRPPILPLFQQCLAGAKVHRFINIVSFICTPHLVKFCL